MHDGLEERRHARLTDQRQKPAAAVPSQQSRQRLHTCEILRHRRGVNLRHQRTRVLAFHIRETFTDDGDDGIQLVRWNIVRHPAGRGRSRGQVQLRKRCAELTRYVRGRTPAVQVTRYFDGVGQHLTSQAAAALQVRGGRAVVGERRKHARSIGSATGGLKCDGI